MVKCGTKHSTSHSPELKKTSVIVGFKFTEGFRLIISNYFCSKG